MTLRDLATCPALTCLSTVPVSEAASLMAQNDIGFVVVSGEDDKAVGVVTDRDIVIRSVAARREGATVADVMSARPVCVDENATVGEAARLMADHGCRRLPVIDDSRKVVGVLSIDDLLQVAGDELGQIARGLRGARRGHIVL